MSEYYQFAVIISGVGAKISYDSWASYEKAEEGENMGRITTLAKGKNLHSFV